MPRIFKIKIKPVIRDHKLITGFIPVFLENNPGDIPIPPENEVTLGLYEAKQSLSRNYFTSNMIANICADQVLRAVLGQYFKETFHNLYVLLAPEDPLTQQIHDRMMKQPDVLIQDIYFYPDDIAELHTLLENYFI